VNKFDRLLYILNKLDRREPVRVPDLARELEVSERSVYRYLNSLMEAGFPIYYDRERRTYAFTSNFSLRRAFIEKEEALLLGLSKKFFEALFGPRAREIFERIEKKITAPPRTLVFQQIRKILGVQLMNDIPHLLDLLQDLSLQQQGHIQNYYWYCAEKRILFHLLGHHFPLKQE